MGIEVCEWISGISGLKYKKAAQDGDAIMGYVDADYVGNVDIGKPLSGYVFTMFGTAICWKANLQPVVALSTTKSKYIALAKGVKEALWLKEMIGELGIVQNCVTIHYDSQSVIHLANHHIYHERMKHIDVRLHFIRDVVESEDNPADVFTKSLPRSKFKHCLDLINFS